MRLIYLIVALFLTACAPKLEPGQVMTSQGIVQGKTEQGLTAYLGLKYAAAARWEAPIAAPKADGVSMADTFGPACPPEAAGRTARFWRVTALLLSRSITVSAR